MAKEVPSREIINEIFKATHSILKFSPKKMWIDYDKEGDVLYKF